ncbi:MAG: ThiF family adenylyltransferase [Solirubrobacterales bacterium]
MAQHSLSRTELLIGKEALERLKNSKVVVLGVGGVGSFATEALARSGVGSLVLVDDDTVCLTNINRQIIADYNTINKNKVDVMKERILAINPKCKVTTHKTFITGENIPEIITENVDYVVDAIDTITSKIALAVWCRDKGISLISSMGTGNKLDPTQFKITDIYKTKICPLAKVMRRELKKRGVEKLKVLYSPEEPLKPDADEMNVCKDNCICGDGSSKKCKVKRQTPGSISFVPPVAGMIIAGEVIKDIIKDIV